MAGNKKHKTDADKARLLKALEESLGIVTTACRAANVSRWYYYKLMEEDEEFKKAVTELTDVTLDFAENSLLKQIRVGDTAATIFYLKTKGKRRGYIEKADIDLNLGMSQYTVDNIADLVVKFMKAKDKENDT